jgi:hypothetical protein
MNSVEAVFSRSPWHLKRVVAKITELINDKGRIPHMEKEICQTRIRTYH